MEANASNAKAENVCNIRLAGETSPINVLKMSVIYGANASGKTNIIRFLYAFKKLIRNEGRLGGEHIFLYDPFKFDMDSLNQPSEFLIDFVVRNTKYSYYFIFDKSCILKEELAYYPDGEFVLLFERKVSKGKHFLKMGESQNKASFEVFGNQLLLSKFAIDTPEETITPAAQYLSNIIAINAYHPMMLNALFDEVAEWVSRNQENKQRLSRLLAFADTGVKSLTIKKNPDSALDEYDVKTGHTLYKGTDKTQKKEYLPLAEESYGTRSLFALGGKILQAIDEGLPIFVDEIDSGLHTYITKFLTDLFRDEKINSKNAQLILTTHDINLLDQNVIRRDQVWFTEKDEYGCSELFSLSDFKDVREDTPFAKWYINDKFGAVPCLQSLAKLFGANNSHI
jgi:AAA15 family ATPase/GTPase